MRGDESDTMITATLLEKDGENLSVRPWSRAWWRFCFWLATSLLFAIVGWMMFGLWRPRFPKALYHQKSLPLNCGHRGAAGLAPENTLLAFQAATRVRAHCVEFDVMLSKDKQVVVFHDLLIHKRLFAQGQVNRMTVGQLKQIDVSSYFLEHRMLSPVPKAFHAARIPTLEEVFRYYQAFPDVWLNIELKSNQARNDGLETSVAALVQQFRYEHRVMVSSFNPFSLGRFAKIMPDIPRGLIYSPENPIYLRQLWFLRIAKPDTLNPKHTLINEAYMAWAHRHGYAVHTWTVNDEEEMRRLIGLGVQMIITDYPDRLAKILDTRNTP